MSRRNVIDPHNQRRKAALEVFTMWVSVASAVLFGCFFVLATGLNTAAFWAAVSACGAAAGWACVRWRVPPHVELAAPETDDANAETPNEGGWDIVSFLMAAVAVPLFFVVALLARGWLVVVIVVGIAFTTNDASWWSVAVAVACGIATSVIAEFAVNIPLQRRWGFALD